MADYRTDPSFKRRFKKKPQAQQDAVIECIQRLLTAPRSSGLRTKRLMHGPKSEAIFYARIDRSNRITFHWDGSTMVFRNHCHKTDVLRSP